MDEMRFDPREERWQLCEGLQDYLFLRGIDTVAKLLALTDWQILDLQIPGVGLKKLKDLQVVREIVRDEVTLAEGRELEEKREFDLADPYWRVPGKMVAVLRDEVKTPEDFLQVARERFKGISGIGVQKLQALSWAQLQVCQYYQLKKPPTVEKAVMRLSVSSLENLSAQEAGFVALARALGVEVTERTERMPRKAYMRERKRRS